MRKYRCDLCQDDPRVFSPLKPKNKLIDLTGQTFHRLTVNHLVGMNPHRQGFWCCSCACGGAAIIQGTPLQKEHTRSCGCLVKELINAGQFQPVNGMSKSVTYKSWRGMLTRCLNPKAPDFVRYGGRGITVCPQWQTSFEAFLADVGERPPGMTLDRIDVNRGYEPGNVQWASARHQSNNKRTNRLLTFEGKTQSVAQWATDTGLTAMAIYSRLKAGWDLHRVLRTPLRVSSRVGHADIVLPQSLYASNYKHGMSQTRLHRIWRGILNRCYNPRTPSYIDYGGRGIVVCDRWRTSFLAFYEDVGDPPQGMSLNRRDNDGPYAPTNVVWATPREQNNNKRNNRLLHHGGKAQSVAGWAAEVGIPLSTLHGRLSLGWALDRALAPPAQLDQIKGVLCDND